MAASKICPHCGRKYRIEKTDRDRRLKCRYCGEFFTFEAIAEPSDLEDAPPPKPRRRTDLPGWVLLAGCATLAAAVWFGGPLLSGLGRGGPSDRFYAALAAEYDAITEAVEDADSVEAAGDAKLPLAARVNEVNRLLADPRPFGRSKKSVGAAVWREHEAGLVAKLDRLREAKREKFDLQGVGKPALPGVDRTAADDAGFAEGARPVSDATPAAGASERSASCRTFGIAIRSLALAAG